MGDNVYKISRVGGIIAAASKRVAQPLKQIGDISIIRRIVITYQQAGIFPIVIITGKDEYEVKHQLAGYGVVFLQCDNCENPELLDSLKLGIKYLKDKCDKIAFTPVNVPMFMASTISRMIVEEGQMIAPSYKGKGGHPVIIDASIITTLLNYNGEGGLRGAVEKNIISRRWVEVEDKGILAGVNREEDLCALLGEHNDSLLQPVLHMQLEREVPFFNTRTKLLLFLIDDTNNMKQSCSYSGIAYSKAWNMINTLEQSLGYSVVERKHGGQDGGKTCLTERGRKLLVAFQRFEERVRAEALKSFDELLLNTGIVYKDTPYIENDNK